MSARTDLGISMFETVAALTIVSMTAVSALAAVASELRTTERARRAIEAEALAIQRVDFLNMMTEQELQSLPDSVRKGKFAEPLDEYSWETASSVESSQAGVYNVTITIRWPNNSYVVRTAQYRRPPLATSR
jgi:Tfp pilus assembly protein PilV